MDAFALDDFSASNSNDHFIIIKGKRNKRPRLPSPVRRSVISTSGESGRSDTGSRHRDQYTAIDSETPTGAVTSKYGIKDGLISYAPSFTMSSDHSNGSIDSSTTLEDENMANCLIHLAQSGGCVKQEEVKIKSYINKRFSEMVSNSSTKSKAGFFVYECKTCNRNFPSFQALGGHRASHKKLRILVEDQKTIIPSCKQNLDENEEEEVGGKFKRLSDDTGPVFTMKLAHKDLVGNPKAKIHDCSICGSEFSSGQALGGHMRRHRNSSNAKVNSIDVKSVETTEKSSPRRVFQLDLNLPAPEDDHRELKFQFAADQQRLVFTSSGPALVDCHY